MPATFGRPIELGTLGGMDSAVKSSFDVFLSHNAQDKPRVLRLAERLREAGLRVWLDEWVIRLGDIIALKVDEGLEQSQSGRHRASKSLVSHKALKHG